MSDDEIARVARPIELVAAYRRLQSLIEAAYGADGFGMAREMIEDEPVWKCELGIHQTERMANCLIRDGE